MKPKVYRALKVKAATTDRPVSELVNALEQVIQKLKCDGTYDAVRLVKAVKIGKLRGHPA